MRFPAAITSRAFTLGVLTLAVLQSAQASQHDHDGHEHHHDDHHDHSHQPHHDHDHEQENSHAHGHRHDQDADIYAGYFQDSQIKDRSLADWQGDWQSVYPFLQSGALDRVFAYKAERAEEKTAQAYKKYYEMGYQTEVDRIVIQGDAVSFYHGGDVVTGTYGYDGFEILTYKAGNRGVRYIFALEDDAANANPGLPDFIQFSDHSIFPTQAGHFHLYWGDDRQALLDEVTNWPTYYPTDMSGQQVAEEMMSH